MSTKRYAPEFKDEAVRQVIERGDPVVEVAERLGVSTHSLHKWVKAVKSAQPDPHATELVEAQSEIRKLRAELRRVEEERDILKKAARYGSDAWMRFPFVSKSKPNHCITNGQPQFYDHCHPLPDTNKVVAESIYTFVSKLID